MIKKMILSSEKCNPCHISIGKIEYDHIIIGYPFSNKVNLNVS